MQPKNSKPTNASQFDAAWAEFAARASKKEPPAGSLSVYQFAEMAGKSVPQARYFLNREVQAGRMTSGTYSVLVNGQHHTVKLYTPAVPKKATTKRL
jgi:hypothetical protein